MSISTKLVLVVVVVLNKLTRAFFGFDKPRTLLLYCKQLGRSTIQAMLIFPLLYLKYVRVCKRLGVLSPLQRLIFVGVIDCQGVASSQRPLQVCNLWRIKIVIDCKVAACNHRLCRRRFRIHETEEAENQTVASTIRFSCILSVCPQLGRGICSWPYLNILREWPGTLPVASLTLG